MKKIKGFKAFNKGLKCRNFQFKENEIFEQSGKLTICENGFHFCENPMDVMDYYDITDCEFAEVESLGETQTQENKTVTNKIKIGVKLDLSAFIKASFNFLWEKTGKRDKNNIVDSGYYSQVATSGNSSQVATSGDSSQVATSGDSSKVATSGDSSKVATSGNSSKVATSGNYSKVATSGDSSKVATSGNSSQVATSGDYSKVATSGNYSKVATSGDYSQVEITAKNSIGASIGKNSKVSGIIDTWIVLSEIDDNGDIKEVKTAKIDGTILKENTFYQLINGEFTEVK